MKKKKETPTEPATQKEESENAEQDSPESGSEKKTGKAVPLKEAKEYSTENTLQAEEWGKTTQKGGDGTKRYGGENNPKPEKGGNVDYGKGSNSK